MAYKRINDPYVRGCMKEYICDTDADFTNLPESCVGSTAVSIESGKVMVVNTEGNWVEFGVPAKTTSAVGTWKFNEGTLTSACPFSASNTPARIAFTTDVNFIYHDYTENEEGIEKETNSFIGMFTPYGTVLYFAVDENNSTDAIGMSGFTNGFDGVIHITGGDDVENEIIIAWLQENATKIA